jgi:hypothetical protein
MDIIVNINNININEENILEKNKINIINNKLNIVNTKNDNTNKIYKNTNIINIYDDILINYFPKDCKENFKNNNKFIILLGEHNRFIYLLKLLINNMTLLKMQFNIYIHSINKDGIFDFINNIYFDYELEKKYVFTKNKIYFNPADENYLTKVDNFIKTINNNLLNRKTPSHIIIVLDSYIQKTIIYNLSELFVNEEFINDINNLKLYFLNKGKNNNPVLSSYLIKILFDNHTNNINKIIVNNLNFNYFNETCDILNFINYFNILSYPIDNSISKVENTSSTKIADKLVNNIKPSIENKSSPKFAGDVVNNMKYRVEIKSPPKNVGNTINNIKPKVEIKSSPRFESKVKSRGNIKSTPKVEIKETQMDNISPIKNTTPTNKMELVAYVENKDYVKIFNKLKALNKILFDSSVSNYVKLQMLNYDITTEGTKNIITDFKITLKVLLEQINNL